MMATTPISRNPMAAISLTFLCLMAAAPVAAAQTATSPAAPIVPPTNNYWVYVGAESADLIHRIKFGPGGTVVEKTIQVGELATEMEGPHGLIISKDGKYLHMTTGHGFPDGKYWKFELGPDTLVGPSIHLGNFPATLDVTPDGLYTFSSNFNFHGDMVPSSVSVVYTPKNEEVARIVTCTMPHGSRIDPTGNFDYTGCMMDDQLVEIDTRSFEVSRRFSVAKGKEGPIAVATMDHAGMAGMTGMDHGAKGPTIDPAEVGQAPEMAGHKMAPQSCSPTWAQPAAVGHMIYVACNKSDEILAIDGTTWTLAGRMKTGRGPYNLGVTPDGKLLVATLKQGGGFEIFDIASGKSLAQLKNSTTVANGVAITPDSRYAFVASEGVGAAPGKLDVYDLKAFAKVGTADVGQQAGGIAYWKMEPAK